MPVQDARLLVPSFSEWSPMFVKPSASPFPARLQPLGPSRHTVEPACSNRKCLLQDLPRSLVLRTALGELRSPLPLSSLYAGVGVRRIQHLHWRVWQLFLLLPAQYSIPKFLNPGTIGELMGPEKVLFRAGDAA